MKSITIDRELPPSNDNDAALTSVTLEIDFCLRELLQICRRARKARLPLFEYVRKKILAEP